MSTDESPIAAAKATAAAELLLALCLLETEHRDEIGPRDPARHKQHLKRAVNAIVEASAMRAVEVLRTGRAGQ